jgi:hypothetical protein
MKLKTAMAVGIDPKESGNWYLSYTKQYCSAVYNEGKYK